MTYFTKIANFNAALKWMNPMKNCNNQIAQVVNQLEDVFKKTGSISILNIEIEKQVSPGRRLDAVIELQLPHKKKGRLWIE